MFAIVNMNVLVRLLLAGAVTGALQDGLTLDPTEPNAGGNFPMMINKTTK